MLTSLYTYKASLGSGVKRAASVAGDDAIYISKGGEICLLPLRISVYIFLGANGLQTQQQDRKHRIVGMHSSLRATHIPQRVVKLGCGAAAAAAVCTHSLQFASTGCPMFVPTSRFTEALPLADTKISLLSPY